MKKTLMLSLVAVLALGVAGLTWAAYPSADATNDAPAVAAVEKALATEPSAIEAFEAENEALAGDLDALFDEPVQVANCCTIECYETRGECWDACVGEPDVFACRQQCNAEFEACKAGC